MTTSYPRWPGDPAGSFVAGFAQVFARAGWSVTVLAPDDPLASIREDAILAPSGQAPGRIERVRYALLRGQQRLFYHAGTPENLSRDPWLLLQMPPFLLSLRRRLHTLAPRSSLIVGHWLLPSAWIASRVAIHATRVVGVCHSGDLWLLEQLPGRTFLASQLLHGCQRLLFVGGHLLDRFGRMLCSPADRRLLGTRGLILPMGVEAPSCSSETERLRLRQELGWGPRLVALFLGRFVPIKGLDSLLRAAHGLPLELVLAGDGPEGPQLRELATTLGIRCRFPGWVADERKARYLQAADVLVLPSRDLGQRSEGTPVALLEALAAGLPVLAAAVGGVAEVVWPGYNGWLVEHGSEANRLQAWQTALHQLSLGQSDWPGLREGARRSGAMFRWESLGPRLVQELSV